MTFKYKVDILDLLRNAGYSTYRIRKEGILGEGTLTKIRAGQMISLENLGIICDLLGCFPWDLIESISDINQ